ncbi:MFS transporter [archaeon]|nr:MAG: MFS transporter [archaeon]
MHQFGLSFFFYLILTSVYAHSTQPIFITLNKTPFTLYRFFLGVGIGGEYPLSAAITSEGSTIDTQNRNLALVFSMQGIGTVLCSMVLVILTQTFGSDYNIQWRLALGLGAVPMLCVSYFRFTMHEQEWKTNSGRDDDTQSYTGQSKQLVYSPLPNQLAGNSTDPESVRDSHSTQPLPVHQHATTTSKPSLSAQLIRSVHHVCHILYTERYKVLGTAGSWFILDIVFYANGLFSGQVTTSMHTAKSPKGEALAALILQSIALPGYVCTVLYSQSLTLRGLQLGGFVATGVCFLLLATFQSYLVKIPALYVMLYGLTFFFQV